MARVASYGTVDEANAALGLLLAVPLPEDVRALVVHLQHQLFDLGAELCIPGHAAIRRRLGPGTAAGPLQRRPADAEGIHPAGRRRSAPRAAIWPAPSSAAPSAETVTLARHEAVRSEALQYLNRLSDLLFVLARVLARADGQGEALWQPQQRQR
jgi:cob(I)alamin adenosyltransferase